jgi:hypothetical protein
MFGFLTLKLLRLFSSPPSPEFMTVQTWNHAPLVNDILSFHMLLLTIHRLTQPLAAYVAVVTNLALW